ncbi:MAG: chemotaxis-specific protein-glutamate methyltransferase CheB [Gemmataceae bacterium]|nr:chemotaxis-specific protein-glutamate methyltransferase CheB [Gemmataceae bacterium]
MIRVLVTEDSATSRALLVEILRGAAGIEVVGEARDGVEAVQLTQKLRPDVVTMDVRMPRLDGLAATKEIMITAPTPVVIVTATRTDQDVALAMNALQAGAVALLEKPMGPLAPGFAQAVQKLVSTVQAMAQVKVVRHHRPREGPTVEPTAPLQRRAIGGRIIAIATSTGGPAALQTVLGQLPADFRVPILVVQHISRDFTPGLVAWLRTVTRLNVKVAERSESLRANVVYLAPDDHHLGVADTARVELSNAPAIGGFRPSANFLFESVARVFGAATVAVILTGMGEDGVDGLRGVHRAGGHVIAQDEKTSVIFGMPRAAILAGLAHQVLPLEAVAARLQELVG